MNMHHLCIFMRTVTTSRPISPATLPPESGPARP